MLVLASSVAFALGGDTRACALDWEVAGLSPDLLEDCVHHYFVIGTDVFFFAGDAAAVGEQMKRLAALAPLSVTLHSGAPDVRSPWDDAPREVAADWRASLDFSCGRRGKDCRLVATRIHLWVGGGVDAAEVTFPTRAEVALAPEELLRLLSP